MGLTRAFIVLTLMLVLGNAALGEAYYNITSVTSQQLNNAVRIKIEADGAISASVEKWYGAGYYLDFEEVRKQMTDEWDPICYPRVDKIYVHLVNARPTCGSVAHIGRYPVSHVALMTTSEQGATLGLDLVVYLNRLARFRRFKLDDWGGFDAYMYDHHDPSWFEVVLSDDKRSLIITVTTDRLPQVSEHRKPEDVPEGDRQMEVTVQDGLLNIHARNARLTELLEAVSKASGTQMATEGSTERLVTAELPATTPNEFLSRISRAYGLVLNGTPERRVLSNIIARTSSEYMSSSLEQIPVRNLKAEQAREMLPDFLLDYVRVDHERNSLIVSGSKDLADKVREDMARIDEPPTTIEVEAVVIETVSSHDVEHDLGLDYANNDLRLGASPAEGRVALGKTDVPLDQISARVEALAAAQKLRVVGRSSLSVISGGTGELFMGLDKYITFFRRLGDPQPEIEPVNVGVKLTVTPHSGGGTVMMDVAVEVKDVGEVDPITRLPIINTRMVNGVFRVDGGETAAVGGLTQTEYYTSTRRIPILGHLPLLGKLFTKKTRRQAQTELLVLLTPKVMTNAE